MFDTVAFHFRHGFEDYSQRIRALDDLASSLYSLATEFGVAVRDRETVDGGVFVHSCHDRLPQILLVNHLTKKSSSHAGDASVSADSFEVPALGTQWS